MSVSEKLRVLVAHCNPLVTAGLEAILAPQQDFAVVCADIEWRAMRLNQLAESTGVLVTDCETGLWLLTGNRCRGWRIVIVTQDDSEASIRHAVDLGTHGYLLLSSTPAEVVRAVRGAIAGGATLEPLVAAKLRDGLSRDPLTPRETEVLRLVMLGLGDKAIANAIDRAVGTVKAHVKAILAKLQAASRTEAVAVARRRGLVTEAALLASTSFLNRQNIHRSSGVHVADANSLLGYPVT
jgi:DNA-binding NarL/FixJ family response regulator